MRKSTTTKRVLRELQRSVDKHSPAMARSLKELWKEQRNSDTLLSEYDLRMDYTSLCAGLIVDAWAPASTAGVNSAYANVGAYDDRWVNERARQFVDWMAKTQLEAMHSVSHMAPQLIEGISADEQDQYQRLAIGLTSRDALAVVRYGAHIKQRVENEKVQKALLPAAVTRYANTLLSSRAATIAATELAAAFIAGKRATYALAQRMGLDIGDDREEDVPDKTPSGESKRSLLSDALLGGVGAMFVASLADSPQYEQVWVIQEGACPQCEPLDGTTAAIDEEFPDGEPPLHANCFPAGTVASGPRAVGSTTRWFEGEIVELSLASGDFLSVTPNHPILTPQGWVAAGDLVEGGYVISSSLSKGCAARSNPNDYQGPALIEDVAATLGSASSMSSASVPVAAEDFHGDGVGSEVCIIRTDGLLGHGCDAAFIEPEPQQLLSGGDTQSLTLSGQSSRTLLFKSMLAPPSSFVRGSGVAAALLGRETGDTNLLGLTGSSPSDPSNAQLARYGLARNPVSDGKTILGLAFKVFIDKLRAIRGLPRTRVIRSTIVSDASNANPGVSQHAPHRDTGDTIISGEYIRGNAGEVSLNEIIDIRRCEFAGYVYNLQTIGGWYIANSTIVHNCMCSIEVRSM